MPAASWLTWLRGVQDVGGLPQEHGQAIMRMGYTEEQTNALQIATQKTWQKAVEKLAAAGGYNWQMFGNSDGTEGGPTKANCAAWMRSHCAADMQSECRNGRLGPLTVAATLTRPFLRTERSMMMTADPTGNTSLAAFLVTRPPYGYIGCAPPALSLHVAVPCAA